MGDFFFISGVKFPSCSMFFLLPFPIVYSPGTLLELSFAFFPFIKFGNMVSIDYLDQFFFLNSNDALYFFLLLNLVPW